ncbi:MAG: aminomethyltransferase family protein [Terriglobia bacterium]
MVRSPLIEIQPAAQAATAEYHGALLPAFYSNAVAEHQAVRSAAGLFDFSFRAQFSASGADRLRFIHGMVSNDVKSLTPGQGVYATILDVRGHILADLRIYCCEDRLLLETDADLIEKALATLSHYNIGGRVPLERLDRAALAIEGPASGRILGEALRVPPPGPEQYTHREAQIEGIDLRVVRASMTGEAGYEIWAPPAKVKGLWRLLLDRGRAFGLQPCGWRALETLRIEAGIPVYGSELGEDTLPLEAGLTSALSFNKGCYIGQEIVERARSRGRVNWTLAGLTLESGGAPTPGEKVSSGGKDAGEITSAC